MPGPIDGLRAIEIGDRGEVAGKLLADACAEVIRVEPPQGARSRHTGPFIADRPDVNGSLHHAYLNTNKRGVTLDVSEPDGREQLIELLRDADLFIENYRPQQMRDWGLDYDSLAAVNPDLVMVSGTFVRVNEQGRPIGRYDALHDEQWLTVEQCARTGNMPCQSACLFRRDLAARVGGCDPEVDWVADHDLQIRMMAAGSRCGGRTLKLDRDWAFVRTHANQRSRKRLRFKQAFVRACTRYQKEPNELFTESERKLMLQRALWGEFRFRTRELGHGLRALPAFLRGLRHPSDPGAPHVSGADLPWLLPLGIGSRIIRGITWRLNAARRKDTRDVGWPASARWFA